MIPVEKFLEFGVAGLLAALLAWAIWNMSRTKKANNPGTNSTLMRENISAIRENTSELKSMCGFLKANAEQEREHRVECREGFRRLDARPCQSRSS